MPMMADPHPDSNPAYCRDARGVSCAGLPKLCSICLGYSPAGGRFITEDGSGLSMLKVSGSGNSAAT